MTIGSIELHSRTSLATRLLSALTIRDFDPATDRLYATIFHDDATGVFCEFDLETGWATEIQDTTELDAEMEMIVFPSTLGDIDLDDDVDAADLIVLLGAWGPCDDCGLVSCPADLDGDCDVDGADLILLLGNWV